MDKEKLMILAECDSPDNRAGISSLVDENTLEKVRMTTFDGLNGIRLAASEEPDIIILDIMMPSLPNLGHP